MISSEKRDIQNEEYQSILHKLKVMREAIELVTVKMNDAYAEYQKHQASLVAMKEVADELRAEKLKLEHSP